MDAHVRPRRCMLLVPASNARMMEKAASTEADVVLIDFDDAVVYQDASKKGAQELVPDVLARVDFGTKELVARINAIDTPWWRDDIRASLAAGVSILMPPKADSSRDLLEIVRFLDSLPDADHVRLWPMIETAGAVVNCERIVEEVPRLVGLCFGIGDYTVSVGAYFADTPDRVAYPLGRIVCLARYKGLIPYAPAVVFSNIGSDALVGEWGGYLRRLGYEGALVVHPRHVGVINQIFSPSREEIDAALEMRQAITEARAGNSAAVVVGGKLIEKVNIDIARRTLAIAETLGLIDAQDGS